MATFIRIAATASFLAVAYLSIHTLSNCKSSDEEITPTNLATFQVGKHGRLMFVTGTMNDLPVTLMVDTNSSLTVFDISLRPFLGASIGNAKVETTGGPLWVDQYAAPAVVLDTLTTKSTQPVICIDLAELQAAAGTDFNGILGMDILKQFVVQIDFDEGLLRLLSDVPASDDLGTEIPLTFQAGIPTLQARLAGMSHEFRIDTGSSHNCIDPQTFDFLASSGQLEQGPQYASATPNGPVLARLGSLKKLALGTYMHEEILIDDGPMSLLGLSYLSRFNWTFDFPRGKSYITPSARHRAPELRGTSGLAIQRIDERLMVVGVRPGSPADGLAALGDELVSINDEPASNLDMFRVRELLTAGPEARLRLRFVRSGLPVDGQLITRDRLMR